MLIWETQTLIKLEEIICWKGCEKQYNLSLQRSLYRVFPSSSEYI